MSSQQIADVRDRSLADLEPGLGAAGAGDSYLLSEMRRLRHLPLKQLRVEDLRLLIGQSVGLRFLVPIAIDHIESHPLASGDFYPGDLLRNVMTLDEAFWRDQPELRGRLVTAIEGALERVGKVRTVVEFKGELKASLQRHRAALRSAV